MKTLFDSELLTSGRQTDIPKDQRVYEVYARVNMLTSQMYIGKSEQSAKERFKEDFCKAHNVKHRDYNRKICKAVREHGDEKFEVVLLAKAYCEHAAAIIEDLFIDIFQDTLTGVYNDYRYTEKRIGELRKIANLDNIEFHDKKFINKYFPNMCSIQN